MLEYHADWGYNNFYTLHSWCGLVTLAAFIALVIDHNPYVSPIEYGIIGEGSQISTNQNRESTVFSLLIG